MLLQLCRRVQRSQNLAPSCLVGQLVASLVEDLALVLLGDVVAQRVDALLLFARMSQQVRPVGVRQLECVDFRCNLRRESQVVRVQFLIEKAAASELEVSVHRGRHGTIRHPVEPQDVLPGRYLAGNHIREGDRHDGGKQRGVSTYVPETFVRCSGWQRLRP